MRCAPLIDADGFLLPPIFEGAGMFIQLTRGFQVIVSEEDYHLAETKWYANFSTKTQVYARNYDLGYLHRRIVQPPDGFVVDHRNGCTLDCRRENLRIATSRQNNGNGDEHGCVGLRGVSRARLKYRARIRTPTGRKSLGCFGTEEEAGEAYDAAAREVFGEFAWLNYPPPLTAAVGLEPDIPF